MFIDWKQCAMVINEIPERCIHNGILYIKKQILNLGQLLPHQSFFLMCYLLQVISHG